MMNDDLITFPSFLAEIFLIADNTYSDLDAFGVSYLQSNNFAYLLNNYNKTQLNPYKEFNKFECNLEKIDGISNLSNDIALYVGFIYGKYILRTGEPIKKIIKIMPIKQIINNYDFYHTISEERVIFLSKYEYCLKMNPIRKLRSKNNPKLQLDKNEYNVFIAAHLYKKLFYYKELENLEYRFDVFPYLMNKNTLIVSYNINNNDDIYQIIHSNKYDYLKFDRPNNILFLFSNNEIDIKSDLKDVLMNKTNIAIPFDKVIVFDNTKLIFSNVEFPTQVFYLDINKIDIKEINNRYNNRFTK